MSSFWLVPVVGDPLQVETATWSATMDVLERAGVFGTETLVRMRTRWDTGVPAGDALRIAEALDAHLAGRSGAGGLSGVARPEGRAAVGSAWLARLSRFCRRSDGFTIAAEAVGVLADPPPAAMAPTVRPEPGPTPAPSVPDPAPHRSPVTIVEPTPAAPPSTVGGQRPAARAAAPPPPPKRWESRLRSALGPFAIIVIAAIKLLAKLKFILLLGGKIKFAGTAISALVSVASYSFIFGWRFAVLFVLLLFVHEMGHVIALRREGVPASAPLFIPFMGAIVAMRGLPKDAWVEAKVGLAGPVLGTIGAAAVLALGDAQNSDLLRAAAYTGFFLNLFNLLPITPLDGGRAAAALHPAVWLVGLVLLGGFFVVHPNVIVALILFIGGMDAWRRWKQFRSGSDEVKAYFKVTPLQRIVVASVYFGLIGVLVLAMKVAYVST